MTFWATFLGLAYISALVPTVFLLPRLHLGRRLSILISISLFAIASRYLVSYIATGSFSHPAWPGWLVLCWAFLDSSLFAFLFLQLPAYLFLRRLSVRWRRVCAAALVALSVSVVAVGFANFLALPRVNEVTLTFADLPQSFDGYRIVQMSDLHCAPTTSRARFARIAELANAAKPDLICLTGDYMDGWLGNLGDRIAPLSALSAPDGVLAVTGNHEYYWGWEEWRPFFESLGIRFLENSWTNIVRGSDSILVAGMPDRCAIAPRMRGEDGRQQPDEAASYSYPEHSAAFVGAPEKAFRILLYHRPIDVQFAARRYKVRLQFSGHTHGGAYPGLGGLVARMNDGHVRGLYWWKDGSALYVSPGIGQSGCYPLRLFNPSEITVITLRRGDGE